MKVYQYEDYWKAMYPKCVPEKAEADYCVGDIQHGTVLDSILGKAASYHLVKFPDTDMCIILKRNGTKGAIFKVGLEKPLTTYFNKAKEKANAKQ